MVQQSSSSFSDGFSDEIIELKEISYDGAKEEIAEYFRKNDGIEIGYEELIEELKIDPELVVRACAIHYTFPVLTGALWTSPNSAPVF
jgi:hypothetical protein